MPTYEYECLKCAHEFETFQSISAAPLSRCPKCRSKIRRKIGTGAGLLFKGSGFYITDYRSEGYKKAATAETSSSTSSSGEKTGSAKPESKPKAPAKKAATAAA
ncbi:MAG TPA: zinc ribbon domain-containing protein [Kiritimatiellia bacterium]|nr:zinc ribbon domain-containing protein [Kiritimatiellia bacterium]